MIKLSNLYSQMLYIEKCYALEKLKCLYFILFQVIKNEISLNSLSGSFKYWVKIEILKHLLLVRVLWRHFNVMCYTLIFVCRIENLSCTIKYFALQKIVRDGK